MAAISDRFSGREIERFSRFLAVGAIGTLLDFSILTFLKLAGLPTLFANSISFTAGLANNFTWNRLWTFEDVQKNDWRTQLMQFSAVSLAGLLLNNIILLSLEHVFDNLSGGSEWSYLPAKLVATGLVVFWNYFANRAWTFKH
jgi:putative flippase GtrA